MLYTNGASVSLKQAHSLLKVNPNASLDKIKQSYRRAAMLYHPDTGNGSADVEKFCRIVSAYNTILNDRKSWPANGFSSVSPASGNGTTAGSGRFSVFSLFQKLSVWLF